jgi:hypothetical protein
MDSSAACSQEPERSREEEAQELLGLLARCVAASRRDIAVINRAFVGIRIVKVAASLHAS